MESGVVFETDSIGVCIKIRIWKVRTVGNKKAWPIDSDVTNARKCLEIKQYESLYEERTWNICGQMLKDKRRMKSHKKC